MTVIDVFFAAAEVGRHIVHWAPAIGSFAFAAGGWWAARRIAQRRALRDIPAAPDKVPPVDADALWTCRRIGAEPLADPDHTRRLINQHRDNAGEGDSL